MFDASFGLLLRDDLHHAFDRLEWSLHVKVGQFLFVAVMRILRIAITKWLVSRILSFCNALDSSSDKAYHKPPLRTGFTMSISSSSDTLQHYLYMVWLSLQIASEAPKVSDPIRGSYDGTTVNASRPIYEDSRSGSALTIFDILRRHDTQKSALNAMASAIFLLRVSLCRGVDGRNRFVGRNEITIIDFLIR